MNLFIRQKNYLQKKKILLRNKFKNLMTKEKYAKVIYKINILKNKMKLKN